MAAAGGLPFYARAPSIYNPIFAVGKGEAESPRRPAPKWQEVLPRGARRILRWWMELVLPPPPLQVVKICSQSPDTYSTKIRRYIFPPSRYPRTFLKEGETVLRRCEKYIYTTSGPVSLELQDILTRVLVYNKVCIYLKSKTRCAGVVG